MIDHDREIARRLAARPLAQERHQDRQAAADQQDPGRRPQEPATQQEERGGGRDESFQRETVVDRGRTLEQPDQDRIAGSDGREEAAHPLRRDEEPRRSRSWSSEVVTLMKRSRKVLTRPEQPGGRSAGQICAPALVASLPPGGPSSITERDNHQHDHLTVQREAPGATVARPPRRMLAASVGRRGLERDFQQPVRAPDELPELRFLGWKRDPGQSAGLDDQPLPHEAALSGVEAFALAGLDERVDTFLRELHDQRAANQHREDLPVHGEGVLRAEHPPPAHAVDVGEGLRHGPENWRDLRGRLRRVLGWPRPSGRLGAGWRLGLACLALWLSPPFLAADVGITFFLSRPLRRYVNDRRLAS